jgi:hypothetical protein
MIISMALMKAKQVPGDRNLMIITLIETTFAGTVPEPAQSI